MFEDEDEDEPSGEGGLKDRVNRDVTKYYFLIINLLVLDKKWSRFACTVHSSAVLVLLVPQAQVLYCTVVLVSRI